MEREFQVSKCKKCGVVLSEPKNEERSLCPICGEIGRIHDEHLSEVIGCYDHMRMKGKHAAKGKQFFDARVGADFYLNDQEWRHIERIIDRDNNLYVEKVKDMKTGNVIKEVSERLSDHQGHGTAKSRKE
jgi:hypothetical protein